VAAPATAGPGSASSTSSPGHPARRRRACVPTVAGQLTDAEHCNNFQSMKDSSAEVAAPSGRRTGAPRKTWHGVHKALAEPLRIRLLEWLAEAPRSARQLADCVGLPADRLYYHLGQLEQAGLIEVAEYRPLARGKVERVYAPAEAEPPGDDADPEETAAFLGSMLEATAMDITAAFRARQAGGRREVDLRRGALRLTDAALAELRGNVEQLAARFADPGADGTWTGVVLALVDLQDRPDADPPPRRPA
jgi:DNA-binding transcriptional ArsR family regulator